MRVRARPHGVRANTRFAPDTLTPTPLPRERGFESVFTQVAVVASAQAAFPGAAAPRVESLVASFDQ